MSKGKPFLFNMNTEIEIWKDVPGYEGKYQCSNLGRIKSFYNSGRFLKPAINSKGYFNVLLFKDKKQKNYEIHQLVAMCFLNHIPCGHKYVIDHIDEVKTNNNENNLQIISSRENISKSIKNKLIGANWHKNRNKWQSSICINKKQVYIGLFETEHEAHLAYKDKLKSIQNE